MSNRTSRTCGKSKSNAIDDLCHIDFTRAIGGPKHIDSWLDDVTTPSRIIDFPIGSNLRLEGVGLIVASRKWGRWQAMWNFHTGVLPL